MKKIFSLMLVLIIGLTCFGQTTVKNSLGTNKSEYTYNGISTDTIGVGDSVVAVNIYKETFAKMNCHVYLDLDSLGGTADSVLISLKGKGVDEESFESITTKTWYGTGDTTLYIQTSSSGQYKYWQVDITGYSDSFNAKLTKAKFLFLTD